MLSWSASNVFAALLLVIFTCLLVVYAWFKRRFSYWQQRGVVGPTPSIPFGSYGDVFKSKCQMAELQQRLYYQYKHHRFFGTYMFSEPLLILADYEISSRILGPDFSSFESHGPEINEKLDPLGVHLFNASGKEWKDLRAKLTPVFTTGKLKNMFIIMDKIGDELQDVLKVAADDKKEMEMRDLVARFTTDVIGNCAFGVECNSLRDEDAPFRRCGQRILNHVGLEALKVAMGFFFPKMCEVLGISPQKKDVMEFIYKSVNGTVEYREKNNVKRNDFLDLLLQLKNRTLTDDQGNKLDFGGLTENEFMSQVYLFFVAGFETSSSTTSFALYELARNPDIQEKSRQHIRSVLKKHNGQYTYDSLNEMEYIGNVINETLRMYPPLGVLFRKCNKDYKIPGSDMIIEKDTMTFMPILGMQMDPEYFPEPEKFDPERYAPENRHPQLNKIYMPFGHGPRICIGQRFGIMQSKVALAKLLDKYTFSLSKATDVPMKLKPGFNMTMPLNGIWLKVDYAL